MTLIEPFTGSVLDSDDLAALEQAEQRLDKYLRAFGPLYGIRTELRTRIAELRGPIRAPRPRDRTEIQDRAVKCPRCGTKS